VLIPQLHKLCLEHLPHIHYGLQRQHTQQYYTNAKCHNLPTAIVIMPILLMYGIHMHRS